MSWIYSTLESGLIPDFLIRIGIRNLLKQRLLEEKQGGIEKERERELHLVKELQKSPIALSTEKANEQHYEVPTQFFQKVLGKRMKYSCAYWNPETKNLNEAEESMLQLTCQRAQIQDGESILELGCGWGSLSLWMCEHYPTSQIVAISNSKTQKIYIDSEIEKRKIKNLQILTSDINQFETNLKFDRIISVEMFEHLRNYEAILHRIACWLKNKGTLFIHLFCNRDVTYPFLPKNDSDWMATTFFTGGLMPSESLLLYFQKELKILDHWSVSGTHYARTARAWLQNMDRKKGEIFPIFVDHYGNEAKRHWIRWRVFWMACEELWNFENGKEWLVSHYLFQKP